MADSASPTLTAPLLFSELLAEPATVGTEACLNETERSRASAMMDTRRRHSFVRARLLWRQGARRFALAHDLTVPDFSQLPARGAITPAEAPYRSSLCHTDHLVLTGFNRTSIGVDAEPLDRRADWERLARRWFAAAETDWLHTQPDPAAAFLRLWTLKEAWIKATGRGIAGNLQALVFSPESGRLLTDRTGPEWRAATTTRYGHRVSVLWQGTSEPEWRHRGDLCQVQWQFPEVVSQ